MKKIEFVYREMLFQAMEKNNRKLTQADLARALKISLSTVNLALKPLVKMNAVRINARSFDVIDIKKILYYWASIRNLEKDIIYRTRAAGSVKKIESEMPSDAIFAAYSAYKFRFKDAPADYSEIYLYCDGKHVQDRFVQNDKIPNLFVLKKDEFMSRYGRTVTTAQLFIDLWNLRQWYAKDFLKALEAKLNGILE